MFLSDQLKMTLITVLILWLLGWLCLSLLLIITQCMEYSSRQKLCDLFLSVIFSLGILLLLWPLVTLYIIIKLFSLCLSEHSSKLKCCIGLRSAPYEDDPSTNSTPSITESQLESTPSVTVSECAKQLLQIVYVGHGDDLETNHLLNRETACLICLAPMFYRDLQTMKCEEFNVYSSHPVFDTAKHDDSVVTSCGHVLHYGCLREWLRISPSCPACWNIQSVEQCSILRRRTTEITDASSSSDRTGVRLDDVEIGINRVTKDDCLILDASTLDTLCTPRHSIIITTIEETTRL